MPKSVGSINSTPRTWLAIGAFCIGSSFVIGYHEEHRSAQELLLQRVGSPNETVLQDFTPDLHTNMIQEIQVLGEIKPDQARLVNVGSTEDEHWIFAMPVYAVGEDFVPIVEHQSHIRSGKQRRPMPRERAKEIAHKSAALMEIRNTAFAYAIMQNSQAEEGLTIQSSQRVEILHEIGDRQLIRLTGAIVSGASLLSKISSDMEREGIFSTPDTLLVEPTSPVPSNLFSSQRADQARVLLSSLGIICALLALLLPLVSAVRETRSRRRIDDREVQAAHAFPAVSFFEPLASQAEIAQEEIVNERRRIEESTRQLRGLRAAGAKLLGMCLKTPQ